MSNLKINLEKIRAGQTGKKVQPAQRQATRYKAKPSIKTAERKISEDSKVRETVQKILDEDYNENQYIIFFGKKMDIQDKNEAKATWDELSTEDQRKYVLKYLVENSRLNYLKLFYNEIASYEYDIQNDFMRDYLNNSYSYEDFFVLRKKKPKKGEEPSEESSEDSAVIERKAPVVVDPYRDTRQLLLSNAIINVRNEIKELKMAENDEQAKELEKIYMSKLLEEKSKDTNYGKLIRVYLISEIKKLTDATYIELSDMSVSGLEKLLNKYRQQTANDKQKYKTLIQTLYIIHRNKLLESTDPKLYSIRNILKLFLSLPDNIYEKLTPSQVKILYEKLRTMETIHIEPLKPENKEAYLLYKYIDKIVKGANEDKNINYDFIQYLYHNPKNIERKSILNIIKEYKSSKHENKGVNWSDVAVNQKAINVAAVLLSNSLLDIAPLIEEYQKDGIFVKKVIDEVLNYHKDSIQQFFDKISNICVCLELSSNNIDFMDNIKNFRILPSVLVGLDKTFLREYTRDANYNRLIYKKCILLFAMIILYFEKEDSVESKIDMTKRTITRPDMPELIVCENDNNIPEERIVYYVDDDELRYCFDILDLHERFADKNYINPLTNKAFSNEFVEKYKIQDESDILIYTDPQDNKHYRFAPDILVKRFTSNNYTNPRTGREFAREFINMVSSIYIEEQDREEEKQRQVDEEVNKINLVPNIIDILRSAVNQLEKNDTIDVEILKDFIEQPVEEFTETVEDSEEITKVVEDSEAEMTKVVEDSDAEMTNVVEDSKGEMTNIVEDSDAEMTKVVEDSEENTKVVEESKGEMTNVVEDSETEEKKSLQEESEEIKVIKPVLKGCIACGKEPVLFSSVKLTDPYNIISFCSFKCFENTDLKNPKRKNF